MQNGTTSPKAPAPPVPSTNTPLSGLWSPNIQLKNLFYGFDCVTKNLHSVLPTPNSKVLMITGSSLCTKTPLVKNLETLLGKKHHAATFAGIRQHGPSADIDAALATILERSDDDGEIDTIISLGGGSPIDSAKTIAYRVAQEKGGKWLTHISIPTTLSAAECTPGGGYTKPDGIKTGFMAPQMAVTSVFYDPYFASFTPRDLWLTTGIRALDHAVESLYHPYASEIWKCQALAAAQMLFTYLPKAARDDAHADGDYDTTTKSQLAAFLSSGLKGGNLKGGMGLSHALGHALGSPYGIPHGVTSCYTLGKVVKMKAVASKDDAGQIARLLPAVGATSSGDVVKDACEVGDRIIRLVDELGISPGKLTDKGVSRDEIPIIVNRACGADVDERTRGEVTRLVESLF